MGDRRRVLAVGPGEGMVTGQSSAFLAFVRNSRHAIAVVNTNDEGSPLVLRACRSMRVMLEAAVAVLFRRPECVYISTSRSRRGAIKDLAVIGMARLARIPVVNHLHGISFRQFRDSLGPAYAAVLDRAYGYISVSIVPHESLRSQYARYPAMEVTVVANFVDAELAASLPVRGRPPSQTLNVLFLSNLMPEKGLFELIQAVKAVSEHHPGRVQLRIAGRALASAGMSARDIEARLADEVADRADIEYRGFADSIRKAELLGWADVLALPSYMPEEAIPLAVIEGMAAGCFLIVSDFGVLPDLVAGTAAAVVRTRDAGAIERELSKLIADPAPLVDARDRNRAIAGARHSQAAYVTEIDSIVARTLPA